MQVIALLLLLLSPHVTWGAEPVAATYSVPQAIEEIAHGQQTVRAHLEQARDIKSLAIFNCLDKKKQLVDRLAAVAKNIANKPYKNAVKNNDATTKLKLEERIRLANTTVNKLVPQAALCWCEDSDALARLSPSFLSKQGMMADKMCAGTGERPETQVTIKTPAGEEQISPEERDLETLESEYGFPEIPPGSPYR